MRNKIIFGLIIIFIAFSLCGICQENIIKETSFKLNGFWLLETYVKDSLKIVHLEEDTNIVVKTYIDTNLINTQIKKGWNVLELSFKDNGKGYYQEYYDYQINSKTLTLISCQPIPELKIIDGQVVIHLTGLHSEYIEMVEVLTDKKLVLFNNDYGLKTYKKIK